MFTFIFHTDWGHGWLEVPKAIVESLGVTISPYSFQKEGYYYLEEDCDAYTFDTAAKAAGLKFDVVSKHFEGEHPIKRYDRIVDPKWDINRI